MKDENSLIYTLSATSRKFFEAIKGRNEYGSCIELRLFLFLHSINLQP